MLGAGRTRHNHLLIFTKQFAQMMRSQLQLAQVLDNLADETPQRALRATLTDVAEDVKRGIDLADALEAHPATFSTVYVNIVRAGIASGQLGNALAQIAWYLDAMFEVTRRMRGALSYPIFVIGAFFAVFNAMVFLILPRFRSMYSDLGQELPLPTRILLAIGDVWAGNWYLFLGSFVVLVVVFVSWAASPDGRIIWDRLKLRIPVFGAVWRLGALARFLRTLAVQLQNTVPLLDALEMAGDASGNLYLRAEVYSISDTVERGLGLADAFREHQLFDGIVLQMVSAGEQAGELAPLMVSSADYFDSLMRDRLDIIVSLINPVLTVIIGIGIAAMMIAAFLPVFQLSSAVGA